MTSKAKPSQKAIIREAECIGCTKCIQACPVDAIIGAAKQMHTVIADMCTGCELCIAPCPTDCIELVPITAPSSIMQTQRANMARQRSQARKQRLAKEQAEKIHQQQQNVINASELAARKAAIAAAVARVKAKKMRII